MALYHSSDIIFWGDKMYDKNVFMINNNFCIDENNYATQMTEKVLPFISQYEKSGYFTGVDNTNLFYRKFELENSKAAIVIVHGFTENSHRYDELIYYFLKQNYSVYIYDQRCHGLSDRLSETYNMVYIKKFDDYAEDLNKFLNEHVKSSRIILYGHSMGATVIIRFLQTQNFHVNFCILSAPMLEISTKPYSAKNANLYSDVEAEKKYCPGHDDFDLENRLNNSDYKNFPRYIYSVKKEAANPKLITSGASFGWFKESVRAIKNVFMPENLAKIKTPIALFQYGNDKTVLQNNQNKFASLVSSCEIYRINESLHNIYYMNNKILGTYLQKIFELIESI